MSGRAKPELVLYVKDGCSLCDQARALLADLAVPYRLAEDPRYAERVPVLEIDGAVVGELRITRRQVRRALRRARRTGRPSA